MRVLAMNTEFARSGAARIPWALHRCLQARESAKSASAEELRDLS